jgi:hypothetical protein
MFCRWSTGVSGTRPQASGGQVYLWQGANKCSNPSFRGACLPHAGEAEGTRATAPAVTPRRNPLWDFSLRFSASR